MAWAVVSSLDSPTSGTFVFTGLTLSSYKVICIEIAGVTVTTDGTDVRLTFYVSGSEVTSTYQWATFGVSTANSSLGDTATSTASILLCSDNANWDTGNASTESFRASVYVDEPGGTTLYKRANFVSSSVNPAPNGIVTCGVGLMANAGAIDGIKVGGTSNLTAGKVRILGLA